MYYQLKVTQKKCQVLHTLEPLCKSIETSNVIYSPPVKE